MGVTVFYRGSINDLDRVEDFEDRALDLALELGGHARIWRSCNGNDRRRVVRGVVLNLYPGQEPTSLLIAPEGWLINLCDIEAAEKGTLSGPPWCFVKTQFGPIEGHAALVETLAALKREFFADLEVRDEGQYWETRDLATLNTKMTEVQAAIDGVAEGLRRYGLSREAAEDREILLARVERIAQLVRRTLAQPAEHPPIRPPDDAPELDDGGEETESWWNALYKENRRRQERIHRAIEDHLAGGEAIEDAFDAAMIEETALGLPDDSPPQPIDDWGEASKAEDDEPWKESLPALPGDDAEDFAERECHPLQQRAMDLMLRLHKLLAPRTQMPGGHADALMHGAGEMLGGLAQALGGLSRFSRHGGEAVDGENGTVPFSPPDASPDLGLSMVQLKRALRGAAFALGALFPLRAGGTLDQADFQELRDTIQRLQNDIFAELSRLREG